MTKTEESSATQHAWGEWTHDTDSEPSTHTRACANASCPDKTQTEECSFDENDVDSTCTELGYTEYTCSVCSYSYKVYKTELAPHDYDETNPVETVAGNCTDAGYVIYKCKNCEETEKVDTGIVADKHDYTEATTQPTCTQNGYITYSCAYNHDHDYTEYPEDLKATGHDYDYDNGVVKTPATCSSKGTTTYSCKDCDDTIDVEDIEIDPNNHNYEPDPSLSVDQTCTEDGYDVEVCSYNPDHTNKVYPDEIKATGHAWNDGVVKTPATCSAKGVTLYTCQKCGATEEREDIEINPDAHNWNDGEVTSATCTKAGYTTYTCLNNEEHTNVVAGDEATNHTYSAWVSDQNGQHTKTCTKNCGEEGATVTENCTLDFAEVVKEATCVANAVAKYTCAECGYSEKREIPDTATGVHTAGEWADVEGSNTATCENAGEKQQTTACTVCGEEMTQTVDTDALGHAYPDTWTHVADSQTHQKVCANDPTHIETADCDYKVTESKAADCVNDGYEVYTCADCGDSYTETLTANGHDYADEPFETVEGDCTTAGHKSYKCKYCDDVKTVSTGTVTDNHNWNEGVVTPATCTQAGYTTYTCLNNADHTKVEDVVEATGHTYGDLVSNEDGTHTKTCTKNCGEEGETVKEDCTLVKGDVVTEATCVANEVATYTCECGYSVEQEVADTATGVHTPGTAKNENVVDATFDAPGSYDKVTYCKVCNEVLSSEHVETPQKVAVCVIGDERYATLSSAISASTAGDTITLVSDITLTSYVTVASTKSVTIDFAGYTVYAKTLGILVLGDLTLTDSTGDNGGIVAANAQGDGQAVQVGRAVKPAVSYPNAKLTINGGRYYVYGDHDYAQTHALSSSGNVVIANCTLDTDVVINGGVFSSEEGYTINGKYLVLNTNQTTGAYGGFVVNGGTFVNYNPADGDDSDTMNDTLGEKKFLSEDAVYEIVDGNYVVVTGDYDAYNAALETQSEVDTDGCTAESIEAYNNEVEEAKNELAAATTQQAIDLATKKLEEAQSLLVKVSGFKVTINVVADDNADIDVDAITDLAYGDTATVDLVDALAGYTITKWTVIQDNATTKLAMADKNYEMVVTGDTDITVYVSKTPEDTSNYKKVIVIDRNEKKLGTAYIEKAQDVDLTADAIAGIEAPSLAFYEFKAWEVLTNSDTSIMVKATYTAPGASCNVHFLDGLTFNGVSEYEAYYDETLSVDTDAKLAIATKEDRSDAVAITNNDSIHTPKSNDAYIFIVEDTTTLASTAITGIYYKNSKASFNMIYSLPEGAELVECGAYVVGSDEENVDGYDFDVTDSFKIRSQSQSSNGEYTISVKGVTSFKTVYAKSYVVYVLDGQQITQTSDAVGITVS
jgi:hypothetical protein